MKRLMINFLVY